MLDKESYPPGQVHPTHRLQCKADIKKLLDQGLKLALSGKLSGVSKDEPPFDYTRLTFWLKETLADCYKRVLNELRLELVPRHAEDTKVIIALWELFNEVISNPTAYDKGKLKERLNEFEKCWKTPLAVFNVAYTIDYLDLGSETISIVPVTFLTPHEGTLSDWGIHKETWDRNTSRVGAISMACTRVEAANHYLAFEAGRQSVLDAMDILRVAALRGLARRTTDDELLQWKLGEIWAAKPVDGQVRSPITGWHRPFGPAVTDLSKFVTEGLKATSVEELLKKSALASDIQQRLLGAVQWISHSAIHEGHDHKIVDLCTALEIMLLPNYHRSQKKGRRIPQGHLIALRYYVLGGDLDPVAVKRFYDLRSKIVHGSALRIAGPWHTWNLRLVCYTVLARLIHMAGNNPGVETLKELITAIEPGGLTKFVKQCKDKVFVGPGVSDLRKSAKRRLAQLSGTN